MRRIWLSAIAIIIMASLLGSKCDYGIAPPGDIYPLIGDVIFLGEWPEAATMCYIVIADEKPIELVLNPNLMRGYKELLVGIDSAYVEIELNPGKYGWIFVAILDDSAFTEGEHSLGWRNLAGEFRDPNNMTRLGSIEIGEGMPQEHIRIEVDFDTPYQGIGNPDYFHLINN